MQLTHSKIANNGCRNNNIKGFINSPHRNLNDLVNELQSFWRYPICFIADDQGQRHLPHRVGEIYGDETIQSFENFQFNLILEKIWIEIKKLNKRR